MYSATVLEHLENPRNVGVLADASARGQATNPVCGDELDLYLKVEAGRITGASFTAQACPPCLAAASVLTEIIQQLTLAQAAEISAAVVKQKLAPLPRHKEHCPTLAIDGLRAALQNYRQTQNA